MNPFESGDRKNIPAVLVYLRRGDSLLMLHRNSPDRPEDFHAGKWNGLGGKCEADESYLQCARREVREESGVVLAKEDLHFAGFLQFPNFKPKKTEDWSVMVFTAEVSPAQASQVIIRGAEGSLHWIAMADVLGLNLWPGDLQFLPKVFRGEVFTGAIWYASDGQVERSEWA